MDTWHTGYSGSNSKREVTNAYLGQPNFTQELGKEEQMKPKAKQKKENTD